MDKVRIVCVANGSVIFKICPLSLHRYFDNLATTVYGCIILVYHVVALLSVALNDEFLHLLYSEIVGDDVGNLKESRLQDCVGTVAQTNLLSNSRCVDRIEADIVFR